MVKEGVIRLLFPWSVPKHCPQALEDFFDRRSIISKRCSEEERIMPWSCFEDSGRLA
jgi:hypothetical protein